MPTAGTGYCEITDLLIGDLATPAYIDQQKIVNDAADEIDSKIGFVYITRVDIASGTLARPVKLLLKRLNAFLASGRLLMEVDQSGEEDNLHAYALRLISEATAALDAIASGDLVLEGAPKTATYTEVSNTPLIYNKDSESSVDAFYDRIANPRYVFPDQLFDWQRAPGR